MKKLLTIFVLAAAITTAGCSGAGNIQTETPSQPPRNAESVEEGAYTNVDVNEAEKLIEQGITVVDVRTPQEYEEGHIPDAKLIPLQEIETRLNEFSEDEQYLIVCRSGNRSAQASEILVQNGMKQIYNMTGGMNEWTGEIVQE
ncbi:Rhodanese-related sulfurtransferase [Schinkia azotoformans MEV2011]|uniref:Rhodanese-related sulfurtransferase n=1 Tax=Schinkia azotoformans MEV2011 TaxID=1348973 RepID=A0A072NQM5_SCHAZ|nr:rhodanese-like domain-containing protein [Schinkia azotoformans]KEF39786.1 Rhodanese-related sulfurtransferase [Schinkia azotoformans MEV2011]MEC1694994.1 rhodanese-like domain-containing protein [Schinkia azotoformans]MEC1726800.1 rhodanese-like domain-containing protein [Schinkia azotoformans]MEC1781945.1 rhodanese-like domain-containing protein [Schinkia azotoformans]MED4328814.1 rhodanese-like domain-containing protein [Schinkia azotoformans]